MTAEDWDLEAAEMVEEVMHAVKWVNSGFMH